MIDPGLIEKRRIVLNNGGTVSIQASEFHYCIPRNDIGPYSHVEVGFPRDCVISNEMLAFAEDSDRPEHTVYAYTPVAVVKKFIEDNGGIKEGQLLPMEEK